MISGTILPHLASRDRRLIPQKRDDDEDEDEELMRLRDNVRQWRAEAARKGRPLRLPVMPFLLRNIWTGAMIWFSFLSLSTFFVKTVTQVIQLFAVYCSALNLVVGYCLRGSRRYFLVGGYVGAVCNHHGGMSLMSLLRSKPTDHNSC